MSLYLRGGYWWISIWKGGRHIQRSTKIREKRKARMVEQALRLSGSAQDGLGRVLSVGTDEDEDSGKEVILGLLRAVYGESNKGGTITSLWDEYREVLRIRGKVIEPKTMRDKKSCFSSFSSWCKSRNVKYVGQVKGSVAQKYALSLVGQCSPKRRRNILSHLSAVWNSVIPNHSGLVNPWPVVMPSNCTGESRKAFTREEEQSVLTACKEVHIQWYVASMIARHTGLRYGDVCRLTFGCVDMENGIISIVPHKTKNSSGIVLKIPMATPLRKVMTGWCEENPRRQPTDRVLPWLREYGPKDERRFSTVLTKAGLDPKKYSFHTWRHVAASRMADAGVPIEIRKRILGHTTDAMAEHYTHVQDLSIMKDAVEHAAK